MSTDDVDGALRRLEQAVDRCERAVGARVDALQARCNAAETRLHRLRDETAGARADLDDLIALMGGEREGNRG